jgi:hypothetical protein
MECVLYRILRIKTILAPEKLAACWNIGFTMENIITNAMAAIMRRYITFHDESPFMINKKNKWFKKLTAGL